MKPQVMKSSFPWELRSNIEKFSLKYSLFIVTVKKCFEGHKQ